MLGKNALKFFIAGAWVEPSTTQTLDVVNPATEQPFMKIALGSESDADAAVAAAVAAFSHFATTSKDDRLSLLTALLGQYNRRYDDIAEAISLELGAPLSLARDAQAWAGRFHLEAAIKALETFEFDERRGTSLVTREPIGVCALITPWNWPLNQIMCKVAPAIAAGCTMVLKPSEIAPLSALIFAEVVEAAGFPKGVFNLVNGTGPIVGQRLASHPLVDMVSFTGSTRAGIIVAKAAADTVKRVAQELGGKSANLILPDANLETAITEGVNACFSNSGQSCDAPTRMLVQRDQHARAIEIARTAAEALIVGDPMHGETQIGPVISQVQFDKIQAYIKTGIEEGAELICGGLGRPDGLVAGYFVKPTVFAGVLGDMTIAREEIFGPVLAIMPYDTEDEAIAMANDSVYGLAAYIQSRDLHRARAVARQMRAGSVYINYPEWDAQAPFGGYKQSGNGREYADWGIEDFLEIKGMVGWGDLADAKLLPADPAGIHRAPPMLLRDQPSSLG